MEIGVILRVTQGVTRASTITEARVEKAVRTLHHIASVVVSLGLQHGEDDILAAGHQRLSVVCTQKPRYIGHKRRTRTGIGNIYLRR